MLVIDEVYVCEREKGKFIFSLRSESGELYITICDCWTRAEAMRRGGLDAANAELDFDWYDNARLCAAIRQVVPMPNVWEKLFGIVEDWRIKNG
jgi:hypothetical protein